MMRRTAGLAVRGAGDPEAGVVLVHVLMLSVLLVVLAAGLMKMVYSGHVTVSHIANQDEAKYWAEACLARAYAAWVDDPCQSALDACGGAVSGSYTCCRYTDQDGRSVIVGLDCDNQDLQVRARVEWQ